MLMTMQLPMDMTQSPSSQVEAASLDEQVLHDTRGYKARKPPTTHSQSVQVAPVRLCLRAFLPTIHLCYIFTFDPLTLPSTSSFRTIPHHEDHS